MHLPQIGRASNKLNRLLRNNWEFPTSSSAQIGNSTKTTYFTGQWHFHAFQAAGQQNTSLSEIPSSILSLNYVSLASSTRPAFLEKYYCPARCNSEILVERNMVRLKPRKGSKPGESDGVRISLHYEWVGEAF